MKETLENPAIDALYRISRAIGSTDDAREALGIVIDEIINVLPAQSASVELLNPDKNCLEIEAYRGLPRDIKATQLKTGEGITGWVALHGKPLNVGNVLEDPRYVELDPAVRSELAVPMRTETGIMLGVVNIDSREENAFTDQHVKILTLLTAEATRGLSRLWTIQQLRRTTGHLEVLIDIAQSIATKRDLDETLSTITSRSREILNCRLCAIFLRDPDGKHLSLHSATSPDGKESLEETIALDESSIGTACRRGKTIEINDLPKTEEHHFRDLIQEARLVSMLSCPIKYENKVLGVLNVYTDYAHRFNDTEKRIFETLASLGAAAIRNADLYRRIFQSEESLRRSERLTTLGLLSAEIAHEIRNPLTVIQLLFESLTLEFPAEDPRHRDVEVIKEKLSQLDTIVSRVLDFGKSQQEMHSRFNLNQLIEDTLHLVRLKLRQSGIELAFEPETGTPLLVEVKKGQIQQAILNILLNATQALPDGGKISVSTACESATRGNTAVIRIADNGPGIDPAIQDAIFDSFLTSRPDGTGLGLSIVKRILKSHKGAISVEKTDTEGTTMKLVLPLAGQPR